MSLNPLAPVVDYQSMLNRIFWFTTVTALAALWMLRRNVPALDALMSQLDSAVALDDAKILPIPAGYLLPALAVATFSRIFRLHARIGDWLGLREGFDLDVIINEFARQLRINLQSVDPQRLRKSRHRIMRHGFYQFVSGPQPAIDPQLIHQALDAWSWFWIGLETALVMSGAGLGLIAGRAYLVGFETLGATIVLAAFILSALHRECQRYAIAQVRTILADPNRAAAVREALESLRGDGIRPRHAA